MKETAVEILFKIWLKKNTLHQINGQKPKKWKHNKKVIVKTK